MNLYGVASRARIGTIYPITHSNSLLPPQKGYRDLSNLKFVKSGNDINAQEGTGFLDTIVSLGKLALPLIGSLLGGGPGRVAAIGSEGPPPFVGLGLNPPGTGLSPPGGGFNTDSGAVLDIEGEGLGDIFKKIKKIGRRLGPRAKKRFLPAIKRAVLPRIERQFDRDFPKLQKKLGPLGALLPADKLKMGVLSKLEKVGTGATPKLVLSHPAMAQMEGGQLALLAGLASQFLLPVLGDVVGKLFK